MDMNKLQDLAQKIIDELNTDMAQADKALGEVQANRLKLEGAAQGVVLFFNRINKAVTEAAEQTNATETPAGN